jgi:translation elongation factor EF-1beta
MDKAASKKKVIAKSLIMWEVKPVDSDTNLDDLNAKIKAEICMDGLKWNTDYKKEPVAFGIFKLIIGACVEDDKVSTDDIEEAITAMDELVQSLEVVSFNKL